MSKKKVEDYLNKKIEEYRPEVSEDKLSNECATCSMSEEMHRKHPINTCGKFKRADGGLTSHDGERRKDKW